MTGYEKIEATALKIASIEAEEDGGAIITILADNLAFRVDAEYMTQHQPAVGGYYVFSEDGYKSYLPVEAVEGANAAA